MLSNAYFLAKFRFDTAENEPAKNLQKFLLIFPILLTLTPNPTKVCFGLCTGAVASSATDPVQDAAYQAAVLARDRNESKPGLASLEFFLPASKRFISTIFWITRL